MEFELANYDITYKPAKVNFPAYEEFKRKATEVAEYINDMPVSQDNVKEVKKTLAEARKLSNAINQERINIKKFIMQDYTAFESQVKDITGIIDTADRELRDKVKLLEELEKQEKRDQLRVIWDKRISQYGEIEQWLPDAFDLWLQPRYLNKSVTIKSIEDEMTAWIKQTWQDLVTAQGMGEDFLYEYTCCHDLGTAIRNVKDRVDYMNSINNTDEFLEDVNSDPIGRFTVFGTKDIALTERLLNENEINYKKEN